MSYISQYSKTISHLWGHICTHVRFLGRFFSHTIALWAILGVPVVSAQLISENVQRITLDARGMALSEAFDRVIKQTSINIAIDLELLDGKTSSCQAVDLPVEEALSCILEGTGLETRQLESGTYVLMKGEKFPLLGQVVGQVLDVESGEPLPDAHVFMVELRTGDITNAAGRFSFSKLPPGTYSVAATYLGYQDVIDSVRVVPGEASRVELGMQFEPLITSPIVVSGLVSRMPSQVFEADTVEVSSLNRTFISGDVIRNIGTVIGVRVGDALADVHVQGGGAGEHQYRLDGAPIFIPIPNGGVVGPFSAFAVDKFTVRKAGFGVSHGSSLSGIIEVNHQLNTSLGTRIDAQVDPLSVNGLAMGNMGDRNTLGLNWMVAGRKSIWSLYQPASLSNHFDRWSSPDLYLLNALSPLKRGPNPDHVDVARMEYYENGFGFNVQDQFDFYDFHSAMRIHLGSERSVHASFYRGGNELGDEEVVTGRAWVQNAGDVVQNTGNEVEDMVTVNSNYKWTNTVSQVRYEQVVGSRTFAEWGIWYSRFDLNQDLHQQGYDYFRQGGNGNRQFGYAPFIPLDSIPDFDADDKNSISELGFKTEFNHSAGISHYLTVGLEGVQAESEFLLNVQTLVKSSRDSYEPAVLSEGHWRWSAYLEDAYSINERTSLNLGVRFTYLNNHSTVFAEPRVSFRYDGSSQTIGPWAFQAALGVYRQYVNQFDISSLSINALLPTVRFWLPVGEDVSPSRSVHATGAFLLTPEPSWKVRLEGYYKWQPHTLVIDYARATRPSNGQIPVQSQSDLLIGADGFAYGGALAIEKRTSQVTTIAQYEYSHAVQRIPNRFDGAYLTVPWNVPHRISTSFDVALSNNFTFVGRIENNIGRAWAFRDAYYNFIEPTPLADELTIADDLSDPTSHTLPMVTKVDLGLSYSQNIKNTRLQVRMDLANLLSHSNVDEWVLVQDPLNPGQYNREERPIAPFIPSITVRIGW